MKDEKETRTFVRDAYARLAHGVTASSLSFAENPEMIEEALGMGYTEEELECVPCDCLAGLGCGNPTALADLKEGETVLDLGSGTGLDIFLAAKKIGKSGKAIGIDMTEEMAQMAQHTATQHGYSNVTFLLGEIEYLPFKDASADVIISNCVVNLSPNKAVTFSEMFRVLKPEGYVVVSDVVAPGNISSLLRESFEAWAGCIAGALEKETYMKMIKTAGFKKVRLLSERTFFELGLSKASVERIESIQVKAHKS